LVSQIVDAKAGEFMYGAYIRQVDSSAGFAEKNLDSAGPETATMEAHRWIARSNINLSFASELRDQRDFR
jgi:hypothetical protein